MLKRNQALVKTGIVLLLTGECARSDIEPVIWDWAIEKATEDVKEAKEKNEPVPERAEKILKNGLDKDQKSREVINFFYTQKKLLRTLKNREYGKIVRPVISRSEKIPFKRLAYSIDPTGRAYEMYLKKCANGGVSSSSKLISRNVSIAHVLFMMMDHFDIEPWNRPLLSQLYETQEPVPNNTFYMSSEIKMFSKVGKLEHFGSVAVGALVCPSGVYSTYHLMNKPDETEWKEGKETRFQYHTSNVFRALNCETAIKDIYREKENRNILILGNMTVAKSICRHFLSMKSKYKREITISDSISKVLFVPDNDKAKYALKMLAIPNLYQKLKEDIFPNPENRYESTTEDGIWKDVDCLLWFDGDLRRLCAAIRKKDRRNKRLIILCHDEMMPIVQEIIDLYRQKYTETTIDLQGLTDAYIEEIGKEEPSK